MFFLLTPPPAILTEDLDSVWVILEEESHSVRQIALRITAEVGKENQTP